MNNYIPIATVSEFVVNGTIGTKSAAMTSNGCPSSATFIQLLIPVFTKRKRWDFPEVR